MPSSILLTIDPPTLQGVVGSLTIARVTLQNTSQTVGQYQFKVGGIDSAWARVEPDQVGVFPGEQAAVRLRLQPTAGAMPATYRVIVLATNQTDSLDQGQAILNFTLQSGQAADGNSAAATAAASPVAPNRSEPAAPRGVLSGAPLRAASPGAGQLQVTAGASRVTLLPGSKESLTIGLKNAGGAPLTVELLERGLPDAWVTLDPTQFELAPGQGASATLILLPAADTPAGDYPLTLLARGRDDPALQARLDLMLEVAEPGGLTARVVPFQAEGEAGADFEVQVNSGGASEMQARLSASDGQNACNYTFDPPVVRVPSYGAASSRLRVRAREGLSGADTRTIPFSVEVVVAEGGSGLARADGRLVQRRAAPLVMALTPALQKGADRVTYAVRVQNPGQTPAELRLTGTDPDHALSFEFQPALVSVAPGAEGKTSLTVAPLALSSQPGERVHTFTVRAEPTGGLTAPVEANGRLIQTPVVRPVLALSPAGLTSSGPGKYTLQIQNPRDTPLDLDLRAYDTTGLGEYFVTPSRVQVPAKGKAAATITAQPSSGLMTGEARRLLPFLVEAQGAGLPEPVTAEGSLTQVRAGGGLLPWIILGIVLLLVAAALFLGAPILSSFLGQNRAVVPTPTFSIPLTPTRVAGAIVVPSVPTNVSLNLVTPSPTLVGSFGPTAPSGGIGIPTITSLLATPTQAPLPATAASSGGASATQTPPPVSAPPGIYLLGMRTDPAQPKRALDHTFYGLFLNTLGSDRGFEVCAEYFRLDNLKTSLGISKCTGRTIQNGSHEINLGAAVVGGINSCLPLQARAVYIDGGKNRIPFKKTDGSDFWLNYQVCP